MAEMEEMVNKCYNMALQGDEDELVLDEEIDGEVDALIRIATFLVVGTILTDKMVKFSVFRDLMTSLWRSRKGISIKEIGQKRHLFTFYHIIYMECVLGGGSWLFE
ncbi:unnamed protein product [Cuscuta europaea]|uniref:DUF4283 domain-containing protein n=1 Tax=Cuscuta europaea TaxID=41803 RepID=A0A9P1E7Q5_CUSEU|nr:unnamed protein product [Cuscuta europaea]